MTWHCSRWATSISERGGLDDGDDVTDLYLRDRCTSFTLPGTFYVNETSASYDSYINEDIDAECSDHNRDADWIDHIDTTTLIGQLEDAGYYVCAECETVYETAASLDLHNADNHDDTELENTENYIPEIRTSDGRVLSRWNFELQRYEAVTPTTHTNWSQA